MIFIVEGRRISKVQLIDSNSYQLLVKCEEGGESVVSALYTLEKAVRLLCKEDKTYCVDANNVYECVIHGHVDGKVKIQMWDFLGWSSFAIVDPTQIYTTRKGVGDAIEKYYKNLQA
jgi:hypothetical protein